MPPEHISAPLAGQSVLAAIPPEQDWNWAYVFYLPIPGFFGYRVGSEGSVWSRLMRGNSGRLLPEWRRMSLKKNRYGYLVASLIRDRKRYYRFAHQLVLEAFVGPCPDGMVCRHLDNIRTNNSLYNIRWGTTLENMADRDAAGTTIRGSSQWKSKVTEQDIPVIRRMASDGMNNAAIGRRFGINTGTVRMIVHRKTWAHVL